MSIWLLGGLTIFSLGIIGVYLAKVFTEVKDRPYTTVRAVFAKPAEERIQEPTPLSDDREDLSLPAGSTAFRR